MKLGDRSFSLHGLYGRSNWRPYSLLPTPDHTLRHLVHEWLCDLFGGVTLQLHIAAAAPRGPGAEDAATAAALEARDEVGALGIAAAGGTAPLVQLMDRGGGQTRHIAAVALLALAAHPANKAEISATGGLHAFVVLLSTRSSPDHTKRVAATALHLLAYDHSENRDLLAAENAAPPLIALLRTSPSEASRLASVKALRQLSMDHANARSLVAAGVVGPLMQLFFSNSSAETLGEASSVLWHLCMEPSSRAAVMAAGGRTLWWLYKPYKASEATKANKATRRPRPPKPGAEAGSSLSHPPSDSPPSLLRLDTPSTPTFSPLRPTSSESLDPQPQMMPLCLPLPLSADNATASLQAPPLQAPPLQLMPLPLSAGHAPLAGDMENGACVAPASTAGGESPLARSRVISGHLGGGAKQPHVDAAGAGGDRAVLLDDAARAASLVMTLSSQPSDSHRCRPSPPPRGMLDAVLAAVEGFDPSTAERRPAGDQLARKRQVRRHARAWALGLWGGGAGACRRSSRIDDSSVCSPCPSVPRSARGLARAHAPPPPLAGAVALHFPQAQASESGTDLVHPEGAVEALKIS